MARGGRLTPIGVSAALHAAVAVVLGWIAVEQVREQPSERALVEFELVEAPPAAPEPPPAVVEPEPEPEPIPVEPRPAAVPRDREVVKVAEPVPFSPEGRDVDDGRDAPDPAGAVAAPTTTMVFDMDSEVTGGGGGGSASGHYVTTSTGTIGVAAPGRGGTGTGGGAPGAVDRAGASDVKVARDWTVTSLPEPLNDDDFEPDYPAAARREGREATVTVRVFIDADGNVVDAEVVSGPRRHGFRDAALAYVRRLRFTPARSGDTPVASRIEWTVHFYVHN